MSYPENARVKEKTKIRLGAVNYSPRNREVALVPGDTTAQKISVPFAAAALGWDGDVAPQPVTAFRVVHQHLPVIDSRTMGSITARSVESVTALPVKEQPRRPLTPAYRAARLPRETPFLSLAQCGQRDAPRASATLIHGQVLGSGVSVFRIWG